MIIIKYQKYFVGILVNFYTNCKNNFCRLDKLAFIHIKLLLFFFYKTIKNLVKCKNKIIRQKTNTNLIKKTLRNKSIRDQSWFHFCTGTIDGFFFFCLYFCCFSFLSLTLSFVLNYKQKIPNCFFSKTIFKTIYKKKH